MRGLGLKGFGLRVGFQTTTRASTGRTGFGVSYKVNIILRIPRVIPSNSPNVVRTPPPPHLCRIQAAGAKTAKPEFCLWMKAQWN